MREHMMPYANWLARAAGHVADLLIPAPVLVPAAFFYDQHDDYGLAYFLVGMIGFVIHAYNRWFLAGRTGQSWGATDGTHPPRQRAHRPAYRCGPSLPAGPRTLSG